MKKKFPIIFVATLVILTASVYAGSVLLDKVPSQQMKELLALETKLDLPVPQTRTIADKGSYMDSLGTKHYDRHIALGYKEVSTLDVLRSKLLSDGWSENEKSTIGTTSYFSFRKSSGDSMQCVGGSIYSSVAQDYPLHFSLQASGEYSCDPRN